MIGTTSIEESNEEFLYPSISVCSLRRALIFDSRNYNVSIFNQFLNLSELIHSVHMWEKNDNGKLERMTLSSAYGNLEDRDEIVNNIFLKLHVL